MKSLRKFWLRMKSSSGEHVSTSGSRGTSVICLIYEASSFIMMASPSPSYPCEAYSFGFYRYLLDHLASTCLTNSAPPSD